MEPICPICQRTDCPTGGIACEGYNEDTRRFVVDED